MKVVNVIERNDLASLLPQLPSDKELAEFKADPNHIRHNTRFVRRIPQEFFGIANALAPREFAETNSSYLQPIPYVVFYCVETKEFLIYQRGKGGEESRLHDKFSLGFGGHIEIESSDWLSFRQVVAIETLREIQEETGYQIKDEESNSVFNAIETATILYDDSDAVGSVHVGINFIFAFKNKSEVSEFELDVINNASWMTFAEVGKLYQEGRFESWSNLVIESFIAAVPTEEVSAPEIPAPEQTQEPVSPDAIAVGEVAQNDTQG